MKMSVISGQATSLRSVWMRMGVPSSFRNCFLEDPMRTPCPAAGMMAVTFFRLTEIALLILARNDCGAKVSAASTGFLAVDGAPHCTRLHGLLE